MRVTLGGVDRALARRGVTADRLAILALPQDAQAEPPGAHLTLWLGERTQARPAAWVRDPFGRAALGAGYAPWTAWPASLVLAAGQATPAALGAEEALVTHATVLPRAQWAACVLGALASEDSGGGASVGVLLRGSPPSGSGRGYVAVAAIEDGVGRTRVGRVRSAALEWLDETPTPWRAGETLRAEADGRRLRIAREGVPILEVLDADPILADGRPGLVARRTLATDTAAIAGWLAGPLRQTYVGLITESGDVATSLGLLEPTAEPARWTLTLANVGPVGGAARLSALIR